MKRQPSTSNVWRTINFPTLALAFLHPRNQRRFAWTRGGTRRSGTAEGVEVRFEPTTGAAGPPR